jgi:hypothetical protein
MAAIVGYTPATVARHGNDNGMGFMGNRDGRGLANMRQRAQTIGGQLRDSHLTDGHDPQSAHPNVVGIAPWGATVAAVGRGHAP